MGFRNLTSCTGSPLNVSTWKYCCSKVQKTRENWNTANAVECKHCSIVTHPCLGAFAKFRKVTISFYMSLCPSVRPSVWNSAPTRQIFMKCDIWGFLENLLRNFKFRSNLTRITGNLREDQYTFLIISRPFLLRKRNVSGQLCREN
jgi:hypothetical protein